MRYLFYLIILIFLTSNKILQAQTKLEKGQVSYVTSQNVYIKFASTSGINIKDTLFLKKDSILFPALLVSNKSSTSCVCSRMIKDTFRVSDAVYAKTILPEEKTENKVKTEKSDDNQTLNPDKSPEQAARALDGASEGKIQIKQKIKARLSAASYSNISDRAETTRMRYSFSMQGNHIRNSKFSTDVYATFRHIWNELDSVKRNLNDALKIYSLSVRYDFNESTSLTLGRKINPKISSLGAVDGLQFEKSIGTFLFGALAGSRPDLLDYRFNFSLLQAGAYVGLVSAKDKRYQQTTLGIIEQRNKSAVDRRFVYVQHTNDLAKNLNLFASCEMDLYQKINDETTNKFSLTNLFVSLGYRFSKKINVSLSYDNRKNIIYYESYKSYIDQLIDDETRQGLRFGVNYRPALFLAFGANASWRFQKNATYDSKNLNAYLNINRIPLIRTSVSLTANFLQTSFVESNIYGVRLTKDLAKGRVNGELYYRRVDYNYPVYGYRTNQNIAGASLSWQILKKLGLYLFYEKTFDSKNNNFTLINTKIMQRL